MSTEIFVHEDVSMAKYGPCLGNTQRVYLYLQSRMSSISSLFLDNFTTLLMPKQLSIKQLVLQRIHLINTMGGSESFW